MPFSKRTTVVSAGVGILMLLGASPALACFPTRDRDKPVRDHRVTICHVDGQDRFHKITVDRHAVRAHLRHGDRLPDSQGNCPVNPNDDGGDKGSGGDPSDY